MKMDLNKVNVHTIDIAWLFIYISAFGLSDMIVSKFSRRNKTLYFFILGLIGLFLFFIF